MHQVEAVEVHDLVPGCHEVAHEDLRRVAAGIDLRKGPELGVEPKTRSTTVAVHLSSPVFRSRPSRTPAEVVVFCHFVFMSRRFTNSEQVIVNHARRH